MASAGSGGPPGREEGVRLPRPRSLVRGPAWNYGSQPGSVCCMEILGSGEDSPFPARAESLGRARGAWRLQHSDQLTWVRELGLIRRQEWKWKGVRGRGGGHGPQCSLHRRSPSFPECGALSPTTDRSPTPLTRPASPLLLSLYPGPLNSGSAQSPSLTVRNQLLGIQSPLNLAQH